MRVFDVIATSKNRDSLVVLTRANLSSNLKMFPGKTVPETPEIVKDEPKAKEDVAKAPEATKPCYTPDQKSLVKSPLPLEVKSSLDMSPESSPIVAATAAAVITMSARIPVACRIEEKIKEVKDSKKDEEALDKVLKDIVETPQVGKKVAKRKEEAKNVESRKQDALPEDEKDSQVGKMEQVPEMQKSL